MKELDRNAVKEAWEGIFEEVSRRLGVSADIRSDSERGTYILENIAQFHLGIISNGFDVMAVTEVAKTLREDGKKIGANNNADFANYQQLHALEFVCGKAMNGAVKAIKSGQEPDVQALADFGIKEAQSIGIVERAPEEPTLPHKSAKWLDDEDLDGLPPPSL